jgi:co-chaperonin GroES (HSP10)
MIRVLGDRVLVALPPEPEHVISASGLVLVRDPEKDHKPTHGVVVRVGKKTAVVAVDDVLALLDDLHHTTSAAAVKAAIQALQPAPFDVRVGDVVAFDAWLGETVRLEDVEYRILHEHEILGIVEPKGRAA